MDLTREEEAILNGEEGEGKQKAMELVTALGKIYGADDLIDITSAHLSGASYKTIGDGGLKYLEDMAAGGAKVSVPSTLNPVGMDRERWAEGRDAHLQGVRREAAEDHRPVRSDGHQDHLLVHPLHRGERPVLRGPCGMGRVFRPVVRELLYRGQDEQGGRTRRPRRGEPRRSWGRPPTTAFIWTRRGGRQW